jgi:hypothetical protein
MQETPPLEVDAAGVTMQGLGRATTMVHSKVEPSDSAGDNKVKIAGKCGEEHTATTIAEDISAASSSISSGDGGALDTSNSQGKHGHHTIGNHYPIFPCPHETTGLESSNANKTHDNRQVHL